MKELYIFNDHVVWILINKLFSFTFIGITGTSSFHVLVKVSMKILW